MNLLEINNIKKYYHIRKGVFSRSDCIKAVDGISLSIRAGETVGIVGESGCGKSTLGKLIVGLEKATSGKILLKGNDISRISEKKMKAVRSSFQMVFQDPYSSLNSQKKIYSILDEILMLFTNMSKDKRYERILELIRMVGLKEDHLFRYPKQFSGGQRQRICIARALAVDPEIIVADEPVSSLDVSIQAQIINLLSDIQRETKVSFLFISHDMAVIENISDRIFVMYFGKIVESGISEEIIKRPIHPYTKVLIQAVPDIDKSRMEKNRMGRNNQIELNTDKGCKFSNRCGFAQEICFREEPTLELVNAEREHYCACFLKGK